MFDGKMVAILSGACVAIQLTEIDSQSVKEEVLDVLSKYV